MPAELKKFIKRRFPFLYLHLWHRRREALRLTTASAAWRGRLSPQTEHKSILVFTVHKCASTMVNKLLKTMSASSGLKYIDYEGLFVHRDYPRTGDFHPSITNTSFSPVGFSYGSFRAFRPVPQIEKYRCLLILRDPRDVLTSHYYSMAYSHKVINRQLFETRKRALSMTADEYVLDWMPVFKKRYEEYAQNLLGKNNTLYLKYEDLVADFPSWLQQLMNWCDFQASAETIQAFHSEMSQSPKKEDKDSHRRQGAPGDYQRKLKAETIAALDRELAEVCKVFGYERTEWTG